MSAMQHARRKLDAMDRAIEAIESEWGHMGEIMMRDDAPAGSPTLRILDALRWPDDLTTKDLTIEWWEVYVLLCSARDKFAESVNEVEASP